MTFLIAEDEALKEVLKGMTVSDDKNSARNVEVRFGQPDLEVAQQTFPFVTIDMIDISEARERVMNAAGVKPWYMAPDTLESDGIVYDDWDMPLPIPVNLDYQITSFARQPRHDRQILAQILGTRLPFRFGSLVCKEIETSSGNWDATVRRLDMLGMTKRDTVESGKRMFMNVFTVRVSSEIASPYVKRLYKRVSSVSASVHVSPPNSIASTPPAFTESFTISVPTGTP